MAISKKMQDNFNAQLNREFYSSYLYWAMAAYFESINLGGFAQWMKVQASEEKTHADKFYDFIIARGGEVELDSVAKPPKKWSSPLAAFENAVQHEQEITRNIHALVDLSNQEKDHAAHSFLQWFVDEQVEEEESVTEIVSRLKMIGDAPGPVFMYDGMLGKRKGDDD